MPFSFTCSRCGENLKDHWLVCKYCHQPRWTIITKYLLFGGTALAAAFTILVVDKNQNLACVVALLVAFGVTLILIAVVGTLLGMIGRKEEKKNQATFHAIIDPSGSRNNANDHDKENR